MSEPLRLFGYATRLTVNVDGHELDVTDALKPWESRLDLEEVLVAINHHRAGTPPPRLADPNPARAIELTPEGQRQADRLRGGWPSWLAPRR